MANLDELHPTCGRQLIKIRPSRAPNATADRPITVNRSLAARRQNALVTVPPEITTGFEVAAVLPNGIADLTAPARGDLVIDVVHGAAVGLGRERGGNEATLLATRTHARAGECGTGGPGPLSDPELTFLAAAAAKTSPGRRHTAPCSTTTVTAASSSRSDGATVELWPPRRRRWRSAPAAGSLRCADAGWVTY